MKEYNIYCLIGVSGAGKSTVAAGITEYEKIKCFTTREKRENEVEGEEKFFISKEEFLKLEDDLIASTFYNNHYYGITQGEIIGLEDNHLLYVVDLHGAELLEKNLKKIAGYEKTRIIKIYLDCNYEKTVIRMARRSGNSEEIQIRLNRYKIDVAQRLKCDYIVTNEENQIAQTIDKIREIIRKTS